LEISFFRDLVKIILEKKFDKYISLFKKMNFFIFLFIDSLEVLGVPFGLQNLLPILFGMKKRNYFFSSFFGFIPSFFIMNTIGAGLNSYVEQSDNFNMFELILTPDIYVPILMFLGLMLFSFIIKNKFFDDKN
jgi:uncharacterized membrane protein YdjX (TVP38/TMEM64 family)